MNRIIMTAIAAATFGTVAYAGETASSSDSLMTRSEPATVTVFERDRGISGSDRVSATVGTPSMVDAGLILEPREQAIAKNGQVTVYTFSSNTTNEAVFSPR